MEHILLAPVLGVFIGILMGLTGAGGGILSVPLLVFAFHMPISEAGPIGLTAIALSAGVGSLIGLYSKVLRYKAQRAPNTPMLLIFSAVLIYVSSKMFIQATQTIAGIVPALTKPPPCQLDMSIGKLIWTVPCARSLMLAGACAGFLSGLLGVGGGFIIVPSLKKFTDLPMKAIVATSLGVLAIVSAGGAAISLISGTLDLSIAIPFSGGSLLGLLFGKILERKISGPRVQQIFSIFTFLVALSLIYKCSI
jgi:uncharacterized membrane protein YfcA